jgi:hypothetical protein
MGRLERWTVVSIEVGVGGRTIVSYFLLSMNQDFWRKE